MSRNATFRGANLQYVSAPSTLNNLTDVSIASSTDKDLLQYSAAAGKWSDVAALTLPQINDTSSDHQYVFAVSELAADRTVTLPLLTGNDTFIFAAFAATLSNKTLTSAVLNTGVSGSAVLDQDDMSGNSATQLATQQSIKAYVDAQILTEDTLAELNDTTISGPASNDVLQYSGSAWVDRTYAEAGIVSLTGSETLTNKTLTSPVLNGGALTALTDLDMTSGDKTILDTIGSNTLTIGASGTTVTIPGNLTVTGTTTTVSSTNTVIADKLITLNDGGSASSGTGVGIEVEEDSSATGYLKTAADRAGWEIKAPSTAGILTIDPSANSNTIAFGGSGKTFTISETATIDQDLATTANVTHANLTATGNVALGNAASDTVTITGTIQGASPLVFEGGTANGYETTLAITDPTADRTWTLPDATDTFVGLATADTLSNKTLASPVVTTGDINTPDIDGGTVDAITSLTVANNVDVGSYTVRASGFLADGLTSGQVVYTGTDGVLSSEAALAYNASTNTLTATNISGTLTTASQTAITGVGTVTTGVWNAGAVTSSGAVTGASLVGTLSTAAQTSVTSLGTLTALTVDNVALNGTTIGHTSDTDLLTLASGIVTVAGEVSMTTLDIGGTNVTSTAAELNILDGVTSTAAEINILDGVTSTAAELNIVDGVTSTAAELNLVDGSSANSVVNSKAVIYGSSGELAGTLSTAAQGSVTSLGTLASDLFIGNNVGVVVGHTAHLVIGTYTPEHQQHGTGLADSTMSIVRWGGGQPRLYFGRSATTTIGSFVSGGKLSDGDSVGTIFGCADDGVDMSLEIARQDFVVDDDDPQENAIGGGVTWATHNTSGVLATAMVITSSQNVEIPNGSLFINETENCEMTTGLTINQGAADNEILALKSSDIAHGMTDRTETDTYGILTKRAAGVGGVSLKGYSEAGQGMGLAGHAATENTAKGQGTARTNITLDCLLVASNTSTVHGSQANLVGITNYTNGSVWMVDAEGDIYSPTTNAHIAFTDSYDDAQLVRTLDHVQAGGGREGLIRDKWDEFVTYNEQDLLDAGVLGAPIAEGGMTNTSQLQRLHTGAIWQGYTRQQEMQERIEALETKLLALEGGS